MTRNAAIALIIIAAVAASFLRLPFLSVRAMHTDEAVHAVKFAKLLEQNDYRYDPHEYHGPTLNYFTLISAALTGRTTYQQLDETTLRIVPAAFSILLVLLPLLLIRPLGPAPAAFASILTAISPAFVYYGRYYIQETLFVTFTFAAIVAGWHYLRSRRPLYAVLTGAALALAFATKETFIIVLAALVGASALTVLTARDSRSTKIPANAPKHLILAAIAFAAVSAIFFSSFFANPQGILDSIRTYTIYFSRGGGHDTTHVNPWHYYLSMLTYFRLGSGPVFSEALIIILAILGTVAAFKKRLPANASPAFFRFIAFYTVLLTAMYSVIPYKTPWCLLGFHHGFIILAGLGAWFLLEVASGLAKPVLIVILTAAALHLGYQAWLANYKYYAASENPYVYAHTTEDVPQVANQIRSLAAANADADLPIEVIFPGSDYWPFPWYLRDFDKVAYYETVDLNKPAAPVIVASPQVDDKLMYKLYQLPPPGQKHLYIPLTDEQAYLRPAVPFEVYVRKDLYDRAMRTETITAGDE